MTNRALAYTGTISYGLYLLHKFPFDVEQSFHLGAHPVLMLMAGLAASYVIATLSWFLFEKPILRLKSFFEAKPVLREGANGQLAPVAP
jgi:peptidoglycan/LPS O-acetylase OafA/YrhL